MPLPTSRNTTYDNRTPVKSADLNELQDWMLVALQAAEGAVRAALSAGQGDSPAPASGRMAPVVGVRYPMLVWGGATSIGRRHGTTAAAPLGMISQSVANLANCNTSPWSASGDGTIGIVACNSTSSTATRLMRWNGTAWATADLPVSYNGAARCARIGSNFFVAQADGAIYSSATGATGSWSAATALPANTDYRHLDFVAEGGGVAVGCRGNADTPNGYVLRTTNGGTSWSAVLLPGTSPVVSAVEWDTLRSRFVAVGTQNSVGAIWTSPDGSVWTLLTPTLAHPGTAPTNFSGVVVCDGVYVLASANVDGNGGIYTSLTLPEMTEIPFLNFAGPVVMKRHRTRLVFSATSVDACYISGLI